MITPTAYLMFGAQGSGKSTQGQQLAEEFDLPFFDTGSELRKVVTSRSPLAKTIANDMKAGELVSDKILEVVINQFLAAHPVERGIVMDGYPRTLTEVKQIEKLAARHGWRIIGMFITISDQTIVARISKRAKIEKRSDDQPLIIAERLAIFKKETLPVVEYLRTHQQVIEVDGEPSPAAVTKTMLSVLEKA